MKRCVYFLVILCLASSLFADEAESIHAADESAGAPFNQSKFVPDISLILDTSYTHTNRANDDMAALSIPLFTLVPAEEARHGHTEEYAERGFNFNYAEITLYSIVDPYFDLFAVCELTEEGAGIEEAYFTTRSLPFGFQLKAGKFLSGFGRLNEQHTHYWSFYDMPLVYYSFFGESGLREIGARVSWVAPVDFMLMIACEILQGENQRSFGSEKILHVDGSVIEESQDGPNLYIGNIRSSFDIADMVVLLGASVAAGNARINHGIDRTGREGSAYVGKTAIFGTDITLKYIINSIQSVTFQAEYLYRKMEGDQYLNDASDAMTASELDKTQSGLYAQLVGKLSKRWSIGARYDLLWKNTIAENGGTIDVPDRLPRYSGMIEYNPTEFSRIRIQYNFDKSLYASGADGYENKPCHEIIVQANLAIGAHGAHSF